MKKILSLVLVLVLAFGSFSFAAPSDVTAGTDTANAVDRLMSLNILMGYPDGTFKPESTITRAEFAAVVVRSLGLESAAGLSSPTQFPDVPASHWASGYISVAAGLGVVNGNTDGTFRPSNPVTYEQAVAMVIRALGYEPQVASKGGYPVGGLIIASDLGLLDGVVGTMKQPASRAMVAMLIDNALETPLMIQVGFGTDVKYVISGTDGTDEQTLLGTKLGLDTATWTVDSVNVDDNEIYFDANANTYKAASGVTLDTNLENLEVTIWYKSKTIYVMSIESTVMFDYIDGNSEATVVSLYNADKEYKYVKDTDGDVAVEVTIDGDATPTVAELVDGLYARFVFNDDNRITNVQAMDVDFDNMGLITSKTDTTVKYTNFLNASANTISLNDMDDADFAFVTVDGEMSSYAALKDGMFIQYYVGDEGYYIIATSKAIEGSLTSVNAAIDTITIGGKAYDLLKPGARFSNDVLDTTDSIDAPADLEDLDGTPVKAYMNAYGEVVMVYGDVEETTNTFYGVLKFVSTFNEQVKVEKVVDGDIELVTYSYDIATADLIAGFDGYSVAYGGGAVDSDDVYKFTVDSDNVVTDIEVITDATPLVITSVNDTAHSFVTATAPAGNYFPTSDVTIINLVDPTDVTTVTWAEFEASDIASDVTVVVSTTDDNKKPDVIIVTVDDDDKIGTSSAEYILAYSASAPTLSGGKYSATVKTMDGDLAVVVDNDDITSNNGATLWNHSKDVIVLQKKTNGEYDLINIAVGNEFTTGSALAGISTDTDWTTVDTALTVDTDGIDGQYITFDNGTTYRVADTALVYRVKYTAAGAYDTISASDVSSMVDADSATFVHEDGVIYMMFYRR